MGRQRGVKQIGLAGSVLLLCVLMGGCEALKEKEPEEPGRTVGEEIYTGFENLGAEYSPEDVVNGGGMVCSEGRVVSGSDNWDQFLKSVNEKKPATIRIMQRVAKDNSFYKDVIYDGNDFRMVISVDPTQYDFTYRYLVELEGRRTEKSEKSYLAVLTDDAEVSFEEVIESEARNEAERLVDYQLIFRE